MKQSVAKNTTWFTSSMVLQKMLSFIYFWYISNNLFPDALGKYVFALSFTTLFSIFIDLGLSQVLIRESAKQVYKSNDYLKNVLGIKIPLAVITIIAAVIGINLLGRPELVKILVYLACSIMVLDSFTLSFYSIFRSAQNLKFESIGTILFQIINFALGITALKMTGDVRYLMLALVTASLFNFIFSLSLLKLKLKFSLMPVWQKDVLKHFLKIVPAFALAGIFIKIYNTSDSVLLGILADDEAVGYFAVPAKVVFALQMIIPGSFAAVIYPAYSYFYINSKEKLKLLYEKAFFYLMFLSIPMALGLFILAPEIIYKIWPEYSPAIQTFKIMALAMPFIFLAFATGTLLNACDRQKNNTINRGIITLISVVINLLLIPVYAQLGAGIAFLITNVTLLILDLIWVDKVLVYSKKYLLNSLIKILIAVAVMSAVIYYVDMNLMITVSVGAVVYIVISYLLKTFTLDDIKLFTNTMRRNEENTTSNN
ncbi:flippase [Patescibacteria group bacterium]|nr:flippase [Patescibacteria group bacterium]